MRSEHRETNNPEGGSAFSASMNVIMDDSLKEMSGPAAGAPHKTGILDLFDLLCARGFLRAATRLCVTSKAVAAAAPMGTGRQIYDAARAGRHEQLAVYLEYWCGNDDSPEVLNWAPNPPGVKVDVNIRPVHTQFSDSPLLAAVMHDRLSCVELLVCSAPFVDVNKSKCAPPLHLACRLNRTAMVRALLAAPSINFNKRTDTGTNSLHEAAAYGHEEVTLALLAAKDIGVNAMDRMDRTPLHWAALNGHTELVKILVSVKNIVLNGPDRQEKTPLDLAKQSHNRNIVVILKEAVKKWKVLDAAGNQMYNAAGTGDIARLRALCERWSGNDEVLNFDDRNGNGGRDWVQGTPMLIACLQGDLEAVRLLVATPGVDVNHGNCQSVTPLMESAVWGRVDVARFLLSVPGIDLNMRAREGRTKGLTALSSVRKRIPRMSDQMWLRFQQIAEMLEQAGAQE